MSRERGIGDRRARRIEEGASPPRGSDRQVREEKRRIDLRTRMKDEREPGHERGNAEVRHDCASDPIALEHERRQRRVRQLPCDEELSHRVRLRTGPVPPELGFELSNNASEVDAGERRRKGHQIAGRG
jgi:hypothetical protein